MYYFSCPGCKNNSRFYRVRQQSDSGNTGLGIFFLGGLLASLLFLSYDRRPKIQCAHCGFVFRRPAMGRSPVATTAMLFLFCVLLAALCGVFVDYYPEFFSDLPGWPDLLMAHDFVDQHATGFAVGSIACLVLTTLLACSIAAIGNWRHHRRIKREYEYRPSEFPPQPAPVPPVARQPQVCPKCQYDLTGNESGTCPECGEQFA